MIRTGTLLRAGLVGLAALGLAACQQPTTAASAAPKSTIESAETASGSRFNPDHPNKLRYFSPEGEALNREVTSRLVDACFSTIRDQIKFEGCIRDRFVDAFDDSGKGRDGCARFTTSEEFTECLVAGNTILDIRRRLKDTTPLSANFWSGPDEMVKTFVKSVLILGMGSCGENKSEAAALDCLDGWLAEELDMPSELLGRCPHGLSNPDRQICFGEAIALRYIREHVPRLGGVGT